MRVIAPEGSEVAADNSVANAIVTVEVMQTVDGPLTLPLNVSVLPVNLSSNLACDFPGFPADNCVPPDDKI